MKARSPTGSAASPGTATAGRRGDVYDPATGQVSRAGRLRRRPPRSTPRWRRPRAAFRAWRRRLAGQARRGAVRVPRAGQRRTATSSPRLITAEHGKVLADARRRGRPRPRGRRVRVRHPAPAQGRLLARTSPPASTRTRSASRSAWSRASRRSTSRPWCRCGSFPLAIACGNTFVLKPSREGPVGRRCCWPSCWPRRGCPTACSTSCTATRRRSTRCWTHPDVSAVSLRRLHADRPLRLRDRHRGTASGCRRSAARRTTWWCCPTPTSTWPPTPRSSAGFGSAGERCMAISVARRGRPGRRRAGRAGSRERMAGLRVGAGDRRRLARWARWSPRAHRDKVASYLDGGVAAGRRRWPWTAAAHPVTAARGRLLARPDACSTTSRRR